MKECKILFLTCLTPSLSFTSGNILTYKKKCLKLNLYCHCLQNITVCLFSHNLQWKHDALCQVYSFFALHSF